MSSFGYLGIVIGPAAVGWISGTAGLRTGLAFVAAVALFAALAPLWGAQPGQWRTACVAVPDRE
jgi:sugar phosphate permease